MGSYSALESWATIIPVCLRFPVLRSYVCPCCASRVPVGCTKFSVGCAAARQVVAPADAAPGRIYATRHRTCGNGHGPNPASGEATANSRNGDGEPSGRRPCPVRKQRRAFRQHAACHQHTVFTQHTDTVFTQHKMAPRGGACVVPVAVHRSVYQTVPLVKPRPNQTTPALGCRPDRTITSDRPRPTTYLAGVS